MRSKSLESPVRAGQGRHVWFSGNLMTIKHATQWTVLEARLAAGHAPPLHLHRNEDEAFYVLDGTMRFRCADDVFEVAAGDFVVVPRGTPHAFRVGPDGARTLQMATSQELAAFVEDAGEPAATPTVPVDQAFDRDHVDAAARRHDMVVLGPPLR